MLGTAMTRFALLIWAYQQTGAATTLALLGFFAWLPYVLVSSFAGVLIDRLNRKQIMLWADFGAALSTAFVLLLYTRGELAIWHLYLVEAITSVLDAFQGPAYLAATSTLLTKDEYARSNGMRSLALDLSRVAGPVAGGALLPFIGIGGVMWIDLITFLAAVATLAPIVLPAPRVPAEDEEKQPFAASLRFGFDYILARPGLLGLTVMFVGIEFMAALTYFSVLPALILARTGGNEFRLATVQAAIGIAGILGGLFVSIWGLPRRKIHAIYGGCFLSFLLGDLIFGIGRSMPFWILGSFGAALFIPFISGADRTIWQMKVPPHIQGRVFSASGVFRNGVKPLGYLLAGPLADRLLEPALLPGGSLAPIFGPLVGTGPGAGLGLMFVGTGICGALIGASGYLIRSLRCVEDDLPDHDQLGHDEPKPETEPPSTLAVEV
jgi:DHA3 family macrolide efflux protein-like MFS transporter